MKKTLLKTYMFFIWGPEGACPVVPLKGCMSTTIGGGAVGEREKVKFRKLAGGTCVARRVAETENVKFSELAG